MTGDCCETSCDECRAPTIREQALRVAAAALCDWSDPDAPAGHLHPSIMSIVQADVVIDAILAAGFTIEAAL